MTHAVRGSLYTGKTDTYTHSVGVEDVKAMRQRMGLSQAELAKLLRTSVRNVQDREAGRRPVPGIYVVALVLLAEREERTMKRVIASVEARIRREFPARSIPSVPDQEFEEEGL